MIDEDLANLDDWLRRLRVEYHIYFNGHRKKPPDELRFRVEKLVKKLSESSSLSLTQRFRYNTLVARFYVYRDLWRRTQMAKEQAGNQVISPKKHGKRGRKKTNPGREFAISIADPHEEEQKVRDLFEELQSVRGKDVRGPDISYRQFSDYIAAQTQGLREKSGCTRVVFKVLLDEDSIRFTAKADGP